MSAPGLFIAALPEHILLLGIIGILILDLIHKKQIDAFAPALVTVVLAAVAALSLQDAGYVGAPFPGHYAVDPQTSAAKAILFALAAPVLFLMRAERLETRFALLVLASLYGAGVFLSADSLLMVFLGLEMLSLPLYALVVLGYRRPESAEAALKYLVLGGAGTAILLLGISLTLGATGGLAISDFQQALAGSDFLSRGAVLLVVAFLLKAAIVPFHTWAPDAYEGASVPATAYMATIVKGAVVLALVHLFGPATARPELLGVLIALPLLSMAWGNLAALRQDSFRRLIAYSSIAHAGYLIFALLAPAELRFQAVAFYVLVYGVSTLLAMAVLPTGPDRQRDHVDTLKGLYYRSPFAALLIAMALLSLAGIPPFPGFVAKFVVFQAVMQSGLIWVAVLGLVASYLGLYLYLRIIQYMFMSPSSTTATQQTQNAGSLATAAGALMLAALAALTLLPGAVLAWF